MKTPALLLVFVLFVVTRVRADTVFSTFDPGQSFSTAAFWPVVGPQLDQFAASFVPAQEYSLDAIDVAVALFSGPDSMNIEIATDNNAAPGAAIETVTVNDLSATPAPVGGTFASHPLLIPGKTYWVVLSSDTASDIGWYMNDQGFVGASLFLMGMWISLGTEVSTPTFDVTGTPTNTTVSEPSTLWLLGPVMAAVLLYGTKRMYRRKHVNFRTRC